MTLKSWSTEQAGDPMSFWQDAVCQAVLNVGTERPNGRLRANISGHELHGARYASFRATGHEVVRTPRHVARAQDDNYLISLQQGGDSHVSQGSASFMQAPGEIAILDGRQPFQVMFPRPVRRLLAVIPSAAVEARAPWLRRAAARKIVTHSPMAALARQHIEALAAGKTALSDRETQLLTDNLCNLLALVTSPDDVADTHADAQTSVLLAYCRAHLGDPALSPHKVAAACRMSVRTLHLRFAQTGTSFGRWLLENRLTACAETLRDAAGAQHSIAQIAYLWGFNDQSHFSKAFRARFGASPRDWRAGAGD
jgi:AraC-like DNA-binding protein